MNVHELWAVEWNPHEKQSHVQLLSETLASNVQLVNIYSPGRPLSDWVLMAVTEKSDDADEFVVKLEKELRSNSADIDHDPILDQQEFD